jgi:hypothetical protein
MSHSDNVIDIRKPVKFTIDGRTYMTSVRWQPAANLLMLAGLDPTECGLGELRNHRLRPVRYESSDIVGIHKWARFVSIRDRADVI